MAKQTKNQKAVFEKIEKNKKYALSEADVEAAMRMVEGTARSMGFVVEG